MNLRRQLILSFLSVAIIPLLIVMGYLFYTNISLAFDLYEQNLYNSTVIQTSIIQDQLRQFMVHATHFSTSAPIEDYFSTENTTSALTDNAAASSEILSFTNNTLDTLICYAVTDDEGNIIYTSGSNSDNTVLAEIIATLPEITSQRILEYSFHQEEDSLIVVTPILHPVTLVPSGMLVAVLNNDYLLKSISSHLQIENSSAFIYCKNHNAPVRSKQMIQESLYDLAQTMESQPIGTALTVLNGKLQLLSYHSISQTPWYLVASVPVPSIFSILFTYISVSLIVLLFCIAGILLLARRQSTKMLLPLHELLDKVESFFASGAKTLPPMEFDRKTEIGYLAEKFEGMAADISFTQARLSESNYLYEALLHATYEVCVSVDFNKQTITFSKQTWKDWFDDKTTCNVSEKLLQFFESARSVHGVLNYETLQMIAEQKMEAPVELEACLHIGDNSQDTWYRIIAVPILEQAGITLKTVLHFEDITRQKEEELQLLERSQKDALCGLLNKQALYLLASKFTSLSKINNIVFFIDLDNFKQVNDTLGHAAGDSVLIETARILTSHFRPTDLVARYGGDEFVVFVSGMSYSSAKKKAAGLLKDLTRSIPSQNQEDVMVSSSIGIYCSQAAHAPEYLVNQADKAMYLAKENGKSQYYIIQEEE